MADSVKSYGVDWAVYQAQGDARRLRQQGGDFTIAKLTQDDYQDSAGPRLIREAEAAGLIPGAYHFLIEPGAGKRAGYRNGAGALSAEAQARRFVAQAKLANGGTLSGLICAVDLERLNRTSMDGTTRRSFGSSPNASHARAFVAEFHRQAPGHPILVYTTASYLRGADLSRWTQPTRLWLASWTVSSENQIGGRHGIPESRWRSRVGGITPTIVQYQSGSHGGRAGGVWSDLNASNLTPAQLRELLTRPKVAPAPDPDPEPTPTPDPDPRPGPILVTRYYRRSAGAALRARPWGPVLARVASGSRLLVEAGPSGEKLAERGTRSRRLVAVHALGPSRLRPPLLMSPAGLGSASPSRKPSRSGTGSRRTGPTSSAPATFPVTAAALPSGSSPSAAADGPATSSSPTSE